MDTNVTNLDIFFHILNLFSSIWDFVIDLYMIIEYFCQSQIIYACCILAPILISGIAITWTSRHMRQKTNVNTQAAQTQTDRTLLEKILDCLEKMEDCLQKIVDHHLFMLWLVPFMYKLPLFLHNFRCLCYALRVRSCSQRQEKELIRYNEKYLSELEDAVLLSIIQSSLEAAPQLILQFSILWKEKSPIATTWYKIVGCCVTLVVLGWSCRSYQFNIRRAQRDKAKISFAGSIFLFLWHFPMIVSRVSLAIIALRMSPWYTLVACGFIWLITTLFIHANEDGVYNFCAIETSFVRKHLPIFFFSAVMSAVYFFVHVNLSEGPTRAKYFVYYTLRVLEMLLVIGIWFGYKYPAIEHDWYSVAVPILSAVCFLIGLAFMLIYYRFLHPRKNNEESEGQMANIELLSPNI